MPAWIIGAGMAVGAAANYLSEQDKNKAVQGGIDAHGAQVALGQNNLMTQLYGSQGLSDWSLMNGGAYANAPVAPQKPTPEMFQTHQDGQTHINQQQYQAALAKWTQENQVYEQQLASWRQNADNTAAGATQRWNQLTGGPVIQQLGNIRDIGVQGGTGIARDADKKYAAQNALSAQYGNRLSSQYSAAETPIANFARSREAGIREDSAIAIKNANQASKASMAGLGANTLVGNQLSSNTMEGQRQMQRQLTDVGERQAQLVSGVRLQGAGAQGQWMAGDMNRRAQNDQSRLTLSTQGLERRLALESLQPNMLMSTQQSPVMNPYLGMNPSQLAPGGYSPIGAFGQTLGSGLTAYGGYQMGMQGGGGGGGGGIQPVNNGLANYQGYGGSAYPLM